MLPLLGEVREEARGAREDRHRLRHRRRIAEVEQHRGDRQRDVERERLAPSVGYGSSDVKAVPILARTAGLLAHLAEEREHPIGLVLADAADEAVGYERPSSDPS